MAIVNFPANPTIGDQYNENGITYTWNGAAWTANGAENTDARYVQVTGDTMTGSLNVPSINSGHAGPNNLIINGAMAVTQRTDATTPVVDNSYLVQDRMHFFEATGGAAEVASSGDVPPGEGFSKSLKWNVTTSTGSIAAAQYAAIDYRIEGLDHAQLGWGTAQAKTISVSFWAKSSLTGPFCYSVRNNGTQRHFIREFSLAAADTWERITLTIPGDTAGTWLTDNGLGALHQISFAMGSDFHGTADSWTAGNKVATSNQVNLMSAVSNDFFLTGWQVTATDTALAFQHEDYDTTLRKCKRYYEITSTIGWPRNGDALLLSSAQFKVQKRTTPTITASKIQGGGSGTVSSIFPDTYSVCIYQPTGEANATCQYQVKADAEL